MSENITHTGLLDDSFRLLLASGEICPAFKEVAQSQREFARLGAITRWGDFFTVSLLDKFRQQSKQGALAEDVKPKLAFVLAWLSHRAADRQMKPVFREADPEKTQNPRDCSIYHDAFVFHEIYASGNVKPYHPAMFEDKLESLGAAQNLKVAEVEDLMHALIMRALVELHTLIPDKNDIEGWLDRLYAVRQTFHVDRHRYAQAIAHPDPALWQRFIVEMNFYDRDEPIIAAARALQRGESLSAEQVDEATRAEVKSHYGQALKLGFEYQRAASEFFVSDMTTDELNQHLNIGKLGRDGQYV